MKIIKLWNKIISILEKDSSCRMALIISALMLLFVMHCHTTKIRRLEAGIVILKADISHICDAGMKTVERLINNQDTIRNKIYKSGIIA